MDMSLQVSEDNLFELLLLLFAALRHRLLFGCVFLTWYVYVVFGTAFMMECVYPNEYQQKGNTAPAALKTTMVFSFFGIVASSLLCIGVHNVSRVDGPHPPS
ncbi:GL11738 [Drosophila persimilis]|uniref:GL11738 n=1 Tax=Drosophila persimilis TaxID=7234 RepID=B4ISC0_DROPE|nr:GL11738 [Drosophila persimilis]